MPKEDLKSNCPDYGKRPFGSKKEKDVCFSCIFNIDCARETVEKTKKE
jgi:hypothetical protein